MNSGVLGFPGIKPPALPARQGMARRYQVVDSYLLATTLGVTFDPCPTVDSVVAFEPTDTTPLQATVDITRADSLVMVSLMTRNVRNGTLGAERIRIYDTFNGTSSIVWPANSAGNGAWYTPKGQEGGRHSEAFTALFSLAPGRHIIGARYQAAFTTDAISWLDRMCLLTVLA